MNSELLWHRTAARAAESRGVVCILVVGVRRWQVHELVLKVQLNPFQEANAPITVPTFDQRVRLVGRKYL